MKRPIIILLIILLISGLAVTPAIFSGQTSSSLSFVNSSTEIFFLENNTLLTVTRQDGFTFLSQLLPNGEEQISCSISDAFTVCRLRDGILYLACSTENNTERNTSVYVYNPEELQLEAVYEYPGILVYDKMEFDADPSGKLYFIDYYKQNELLVYDGETLLSSYNHDTPIVLSGIADDGTLYLYAQQESSILYTGNPLSFQFQSITSTDFPMLIDDGHFITLSGEVYTQSYDKVVQLSIFGAFPLFVPTPDSSIFCYRSDRNVISIFDLAARQRIGTLPFEGEILQLAVQDGFVCTLIDGGDKYFLAWGSLDDMIEEEVATLSDDSSLTERMIRTVWENYSPKNSDTNLWDALPRFGGIYESGIIKGTVISDGLNFMNFYRYLAQKPTLSLDENNVLATQMTAELFAFGSGELPPSITSGASHEQQQLASDWLSKSFFALVKKSASPIPDALDILVNEYPEFRMALMDTNVTTVSFGIGESDSDQLYVFVNLTIHPESTASSSALYTAFPSNGMFPLNDLSPQTDWSIFVDTSKVSVASANNLVAKIVNPDSGQVFSFAATWNPNGTVTFPSPLLEESAISAGTRFSVELEGFVLTDYTYGDEGYAKIAYSVTFLDLLPTPQSEVPAPDISSIPEEATENPLSSDPYFLDHVRHILSGFPAGTTVTVLKKNINAENIQVRNAAGLTVTAGKIGTGFLIRIGNEEYTALLLGDINGDGNINTLDMKLLRDCLLGRIQLSGVYALAADLNQDDTIDIADLVTVTHIFKG